MIRNVTILMYLYHITLAILYVTLCMCTIMRLFDVPKKPIKRIILFIGCLLLCGMVMYIGDLANLPPTLILFVLSILYCTNGSIYKKITLSLILSSATLSINTICDSFFYQDLSWVRLLFWCLIYLLIRKISLENTFDLDKTYWRLLLLLTLTPLGIVLCVVLLQSPYYWTNSSFNITSFLLLIISSLSFIGLLWAVTVLAKQQQLEEDHHLLEINDIYYKNLEQQQFETRRLRHDMANHLQLLSTLPTDEMKRYLDDLINDSAFTNSLTFCNNSTINAVINCKLAKIRSLSIDFQYHISLAQEITLTNTDLCALFSNFLDNAIEACEKITSSPRYITLDVKAEKGLLIIEVKNSCLQESSETQDLNTLKSNSNFLRTSKKDSHNHGYGLRSIQEVVNRYHGSMELKREKDVFCLFLFLRNTFDLN